MVEEVVATLLTALDTTEVVVVVELVIVVVEMFLVFVVEVAIRVAEAVVDVVTIVVVMEGAAEMSLVVGGLEERTVSGAEDRQEEIIFIPCSQTKASLVKTCCLFKGRDKEENFAQRNFPPLVRYERALC